MSPATEYEGCYLGAASTHSSSTAIYLERKRAYSQPSAVDRKEVMAGSRFTDSLGPTNRTCANSDKCNLHIPARCNHVDTVLCKPVPPHDQHGCCKRTDLVLPQWVLQIGRPPALFRMSTGGFDRPVASGLLRQRGLVPLLLHREYGYTKEGVTVTAISIV